MLTVENMTDEQLGRVIKRMEAHTWRMQEYPELTEEEAIREEMSSFAENFEGHEFEV